MHLAISFLLLAGYLARTLFLSIRLPAVVGVILVGYGFRQFIQDDILAARDVLQGFAFLLVLLKAGLEISLQDLNFATLLCSWLPLTVELSGLTLYAKLFLDLTLVEALVLGTVLCPLGEGLVIPKMNELGRLFPEHPMPRLVFACAPLEAAFVLTIFGVFAGFAGQSKSGEGIPLGFVFVGGGLRILITLAMGATVGSLTGYIIPRRTLLSVCQRQVFTGTAVETFLLFFAIAVGIFGLGMEKEDGEPLIPIGFAPGALFNSELLVITTAVFFATWARPDDLRDVVGILGGLWNFGQLVLFSMIGSKMSAEPFRRFTTVLPLMLTGFAFRAVGILFCMYVTRRWRVCSPYCTECKVANRRSFLEDSLFFIVSVLPRATLQGALGSIPLRQKFFAHEEHSHRARVLISDAAQIYIPVLAIVGSLLVDLLGPILLRRSSGKAQRHVEGRNRNRECWASGWMPRLHTAQSYRSAMSQTPSFGSCFLDPLNDFEASLGASSFPGAQRALDEHQLAAGHGGSLSASLRTNGLPLSPDASRR